MMDINEVVVGVRRYRYLQRWCVDVVAILPGEFPGIDPATTTPYKNADFYSQNADRWEKKYSLTMLDIGSSWGTFPTHNTMHDAFKEGRQL